MQRSIGESTVPQVAAPWWLRHNHHHGPAFCSASPASSRVRVSATYRFVAADAKLDAQPWLRRRLVLALWLAASLVAFWMVWLCSARVAAVGAPRT
jgi:hypothetical protein